MRVNKKQWMQFFIIAGFTVVVFVILIKSFDINNLWEVISGSSKKHILIGLAISWLGLPLGAWRWQNTLKMFGYHVNFTRVMLVNLANAPFMIIPGRLGDLVKSYSIKNKVPVSKSINSIILEKIIDVLSLLILIVIGSLIIKRYEWGILALITILGIFLIGGLVVPRVNKKLITKLVRLEKIKKIIEELPDLIKIIRNHKKLYLTTQIVSITNWLATSVMIYYFFIALGVTISFITVVATLPITIFIGLIPITIAGMGTRDAAMIKIFSDFATPSQALGVGILYSFLNYWLAIIIGLFFLKYFSPRD